MALATASLFAHRLGLFIFLILLTVVLAAVPIALSHFELQSVATRLRDIEYRINTAADDRIFARESERHPLRVEWTDADKRAVQRRWRRLVRRSRIYGDHWQRSVRDFGETVRTNVSRHRPFR
jgi:hypothetical protein